MPRRENEDAHFDCVFNSTSILMVLDGHDGSRALEYVKEQIPEKILRMVEETISPEEIRSKLATIFKEVEEGFFKSMDELLTERVILKMDLNVSYFLAVRSSVVVSLRADHLLYPFHRNVLTLQ